MLSLKNALAALLIASTLLGQPSRSAETSPLAAEDLAGKRILVLGDSITQDGRYVSYLEYYLNRLHRHDTFDIVSIGLASETTSGLTEEGHPFPRPCVHERLERALEKVKPQVVIACYGMNDGIYHPQSPERMKRYQDGILRLIRTSQAHGVKQIVLLTPPVFDATAYKGNVMQDGEAWRYFRPYVKYDDVLADYTRWLMSLKLDGVAVVDVHSAMAAALAQRRKSDPAFRFAGDGVHPGDAGHLIMAHAVLRALGEKFGDSKAEDEANGIRGNPLFAASNQHRQCRSEGWLPYVGYIRGETFHRDTINDVEKKAAEIQKRIDDLRHEAK